ncbi:sensor histidine kinase [Psychrobacillus psychrodurans]|uniref:histidine kinase n=1 Tax=Psychrobacillus psychrodurans TaxID=126157 RepID=A0A9X3RBV5_9BACI|nr:ATP-binding protein [Psychrobacillus psychrodurans]MCZ8534602.1 ATP-binding protein [Psychrobacillus psychrodurans]
MIPILIFIIIFLLILNGLQYFLRVKMEKNLKEIHTRLSDIIINESAEKVLLQTDQEAVQLVLNQVNRFLSYNQKVKADYVKAKDSSSKMLSNMSHDLKTPLTVILGYVEKLNLNDNMTEDERKEVSDRLYQKTKDVINLLNQFFDLVKIDADDYAIPLKHVAINEVCRKTVLEFYELLKSKGIQVEIVIPEQPLYILGNEEALSRIFNNLISNSIRYGSDGGMFGVTVREEEEFVAVDIWDNGKGIETIHQDRIFERLYTLDDARNPEFQGSGLGLSITKRLTESMKGSIHLSSKPYEKTVFSCIFKRLIY